MFRTLKRDHGKTNSVDYELKFVFNNPISHLILDYIRSRCLPDPLFPYGVVSSIYFDTRNWRLLGEKINSDYFKCKYRIRWYSEFEHGGFGEFSFIEIKKKIGTTRKKKRIKSSIPGKFLDNADLNSEVFFNIASILKADGEIFNDNLFPVFQISYKRWRFVEPITGTRLCIDCDISAPKVNELIFPMTTPLFLNNGVLEIKGSLDELPNPLHKIELLSCRKESFSKYQHCYEKLNEIFHIT
jgi:hypothetical protein